MIKTTIIAALTLAVLMTEASAQSPTHNVSYRICSVYRCWDVKPEANYAIWELSNFPELERKAKAVCTGPYRRSEELEAACKADALPRVTMYGEFRNSGIGVELKDLISRYDFKHRVQEHREILR